ncbi:MAG: hypothetical protein FWC93_05635 [Defluviitaleaceae bacterium]|nr:hypothetical protein [Defluviitaleaceae bacterium]
MSKLKPYEIKIRCLLILLAALPVVLCVILYVVRGPGDLDAGFSVLMPGLYIIYVANPLYLPLLCYVFSAKTVRRLVFCRWVCFGAGALACLVWWAQLIIIEGLAAVYFVAFAAVPAAIVWFCIRAVARRVERRNKDHT